MPFPGANAAGTGASPGALSNTNMPSTGGSNNFAQMLPLLGAGLGSAASTLFGSPGSAPQQAVILSSQGQKLQKNIFNAIMNNGIPFNLASRYIGQGRKIAQIRKRQQSQQLSAMAGGSPSGVTSGRSLTAQIAFNRQNLSDSMAGDRSLGEARRGVAQNNMSNLMNFRNQQRQVPILAAQNQAASRSYDQLIGARKGAALGSLAELAGASYFYA